MGLGLVAGRNADRVQSDRDGNWEIYLMDADGRNPIRLTNNSADDWNPAWSPHGQRIAFVLPRRQR
jgi:Tol biopolymer transport system component